MAKGLNKLSVAYFILCDSHSMNGGKHNYYGVFDRVFSRTFPCVHQKMHVAIEIHGPPEEEHMVRVTFEDSDGSDVIPPAPMGIKLSRFGGNTIGLGIEGLPLPKPGIYSFKVLDNGDCIGQRDLYVDSLPVEKRG